MATTLTDRPAPPPGDGAPQERSRYSVESLRESRPARAALGVLLAVVVVTVIYLIVLTFTGHFTNVVKINAQLPKGSNAVPISAPVEYRNVTVGKVGSETQAPNGGVEVQFLIYPKNLPRIPSNVEAQVSPLSIFGNQYVNLVPPATPGTGHLQRGDVIAPFSGAPSTSLQGTVTQLYKLLHAVHPAALDTALTAFATALNGEGRALGRTLAGTSNYLGQAVVPNLATIKSDLKLLAPVSGEVNQATPNLLGTISNSTVTAGTITSQETALHQLLTSGTSTVGQFGSVLQRVQTSLPSLLNESGPLLADVTQSPTELSQTLSGLTQFASAVAAAESSGPYLKVNANLPVANISAGVNAALGYDNPASITQALGSMVNPATYTSANCPEYPGESNPYCGVGGSPDAQPVGEASVPSSIIAPAPAKTVSAASANRSGAGTPPPAAGVAADASSAPYAAELQAVQAIAAALNGGRPPAQPGLAAVVLMPLLSSITAGS